MADKPKGRRPDIKILAKNKETGASTQVAAGWKNEYGGYNVTFVRQANKWQTPIIELELADFWFSIRDVEETF